MRSGPISALLLVVVAAFLAPSRSECVWLGLSCKRPCCCCPDDYCPKKLPLVLPTCPKLPDDYCPKSLPLTCPVKCAGPDDYCPKKLPTVSPACGGPGYRCGP